MEAGRSYPLNTWYAVAWDVDITRELFARKICDRDLVLYRTSVGEVVAFDDACWHRLVPLSKGWLDGDTVVCGYHGLRFGTDGRCTFMPSQETINPAACVRAYPVVERHRFVWVWLGDPGLADPDLVPDLHWNDDPNWAADGETIHVECDYRLVIDNLMDLTHESYLHAGSIGNDAVAEAPFTTTHGDRQVTVTRWMLDIEPPPFWRAQLGQDGKVDRWQIIHFQAPSTIAIDVGVAPTGTGAPNGDRERGVNGYVLNTMTPETERSCHYFWSFARNYRLTDQARTTQLRQGVSTIFAQDEDMLVAQQQAIEANPDKVFYLLNIDSGPLWARKIIDKMIDEESGGAGRDPILQGLR